MLFSKNMNFATEAKSQKITLSDSDLRYKVLLCRLGLYFSIAGGERISELRFGIYAKCGSIGYLSTIRILRGKLGSGSDFSS